MKTTTIQSALVIAFMIAGSFTTHLHGQVTMGSGIEPHSGALLDLKQNNNTGANSNKGLLLPRVELTDLHNLYPMFPVGYGGYTKATEDAKHIGLAVYNLTDDCDGGFHRGMYVWNGTMWQFQSTTIPDCPPPATPAATPDLILANNEAICAGSSTTLTVSAPEVTNPQFTWYADNITTEPLPSGTSASYSTGTLPTAGVQKYYVSVQGENYIENVVNNRKEVAVTVAPLTPTATPIITFLNNKNVLRTMRQTDDGDTGTSDFTDLTTTVNVTPVAGLTYSWTVTPLYTTGVDDIEVAFTSYPTGSDLNETSLSFAAIGDGTQIIGGAYKVEVTATNAANCTVTPTATANATIYVGCGAQTGANQWSKFMCHNLGATQTADPFIPAEALHGAKYKWGTGLVALTHAEDTSISSMSQIEWASKGGTPPATTADWDMSNANPCPLGYRVPTESEWKGVINYNTWIGKPTTAWNYGADVWDHGMQFGSALFFPAAGNRSHETAILADRGFLGAYWSSTVSDNEYSKFFEFFNDADGPDIDWDDKKSVGYSVRCIAQ